MKRTARASYLTACILACWMMDFGSSLGFQKTFGQDVKNDAVRITAIEPAAVISGTKETLKVRGFKLKEASALRFPMATGVVAEIKEKKDAQRPKGLENKTVGDTQVLVEFTLPSDHPPGMMEYVIATPEGDVAGKFMVLAQGASVDEANPNDGFREAQKLQAVAAQPTAQTVRGNIQGDKDVDVYELPATSGQRLKIAVITGAPLIFDAALHCFDSRGQLLAAADDGESLDPVLTIAAPSDGPVFLCVSSVHDIGGEWHSYLLTIEEVK
jgi:hypothetical protein